MSIAAVVLAAGSSRRLGRPKQNVLLGGISLLQRTLETATQACLVPVIAVVREEAMIPDMPGVRYVRNKEADQGMATSLRAGIADLEMHPELQGAVILTCDQPFLTVAHLKALTCEADRITGSSYAGRVGVPAYFPVGSFPGLCALDGDTGARALLQAAFALQDETLAMDIDTEQDLREAERLFALRPSSLR